MTRWTEAGRALARQFVRQAVERFADRIERIVLFGSVARGTDGPESDIDILVVADDRRSDLRDALDGIAFDLMMSGHRALVFVLYPASVYARARASGSELVAAVEREGTPLWTRSDERSSARA